jgi:hypothetical protein
MAIRVPEEHIVKIKRFLGLPDGMIEAFQTALINAKPEFNITDLTKQVMVGLEVPEGIVEGMIDVLASLYRVSDRRNIPIEKFVDREVFRALKETDILSGANADAQWARLRNFLMTALSLEKTVGTTAKVGYVMTQHERIFVGARIFTDVRPIFHQNVSEKPESAVIIHMLQVTQRDNSGNRVDKYFALDSSDIRNLRALIERALKKEGTLKDLMEGSGVKIIPPKPFF